MKRGASRWMLLLGVAGLLAGLALAEPPAVPKGAVADPPILLRLDGPARVRAPGGAVVLLPPGSEIGACGDVPLRYELGSRVVRVPEPCTDARVFADGFEAP